MKFEIDEPAILNNNGSKVFPSNVGDLVVVKKYREKSHHDYTVQLPNGDFVFVKELALNKLMDEQKELIKYIYRGNRITYIPTKEKASIVKVDFLYNQAEIEFDKGGTLVVEFNSLKPLNKESSGNLEQPQQVTLGKFTEIALEIGEFTDMKNKQYGSSVDATYEIINVLMERYAYDKENYLMPKSLLKHILLQVRMMDKINRVFNNPSGEGDSESPYNDLAGYSLIGIDMVNNK